MANTRTSTKRARQAETRRTNNQEVRGATRSALKGAFDAVRGKDEAKAKEAYQAAVRALSKAASKAAIPKRRAARKISRLTRLAKKSMPSIVPGAK